MNTRVLLFLSTTKCDCDRLRTGTKTGTELGVKLGVNKFKVSLVFEIQILAAQGGISFSMYVDLSHGTISK